MSIETDIGGNTMGSTAYEPPPGPPLSSSAQPSGNMAGGSPSADTPARSAFLAKVYELFNVDTEDVLERCKLSINPLLSTPFLTNGLLDAEQPSNSAAVVHNKLPDMWGPIWIYFTMAFAVFFSSTMVSLVDGLPTEGAGMLSGTAGTLFAFTFAVPVAVWFGIQYFNLVPTLTLAQTVCLYGYSGTVWIPAVVLAGSPLGARSVVGVLASRLVRYISLGIAFVFSARFVYGNLYKVIFAHASQNVVVDKPKAAIVLVAGLVTHAALALTVALL